MSIQSTEPTVMSEATVTVSSPVDGTRKRKPRGKGKRVPLHRHVVVDPRVMAAAKQAKRVGERIVIVNEQEVWLR